MMRAIAKLDIDDCRGGLSSTDVKVGGRGK